MAEIKTPKDFNYLLSITSIDGRFRGRVEKYSKYFSEYAVIAGRVYVEIEYLIALLQEIEKPLSVKQATIVRKIYKNFGIADATEIWNIDEEINHDTKAVEIFLSNKLTTLKLDKLINYLHFGLTSTDVDNTAFSLSVKDFLESEYFLEVGTLVSELAKLSKKQKDLAMPARTHGKIAVPTTAGRELLKYRSRVEFNLDKLKALKIGSKMNGAVGNYNAHYTAFPKKNWERFSKNFLKNLGLAEYKYTTQVEPYDAKVELIQAVKRINYVLIAIDTDIWRYISLGYLTLRDESGHVGSSTMPQKINPIGFEMSESYAHLSNGLLSVLESKLSVNRWQRDLTDKYLLRELGQALVMSILAATATNEAVKQIGFNKEYLRNELDQHWELIAEGVQTILRTTNHPDPYGALKELTRGKDVTKETYEKFILDLDVSDEIKERLSKLSPESYTGIATKDQ